MRWKIGSGDWKKFRRLPGLKDVDVHWSDENDGGYYEDHMKKVYDTALDALKEAYENRCALSPVHTWMEHIPGMEEDYRKVGGPRTHAESRGNALYCSGNS